MIFTTILTFYALTADDLRQGDMLRSQLYDLVAVQDNPHRKAARHSVQYHGFSLQLGSSQSTAS